MQAYELSSQPGMNSPDYSGTGSPVPRRPSSTYTDHFSSPGNTPARRLPDMPDIGQPESYYAKRVQHADKYNDVHTHEAFKVGQYVTLALDPTLTWEQKLKYFRHAIKRHCVAPPYPDDDVWMFYQKLADLVRQHAGHEALRLASTEDDLYAARVTMGQSRQKIEDEAEVFFRKIMPEGDRCPEWFNESDWVQLKLIRDQWI